MKKIGVIGSGTMGLDIAQVFARNGYEVVVNSHSLNEETIAKKQAKIVRSLDKQVAKGRLEEAKKQEILANISLNADIQAVADADLVVESVTEDMEVKKTVFAELDKICKPEALLVTNTSSLSVTSIAAVTGRPEKVVGMHFFNPATVLKLVEVVKGANTSDETFHTAYDLAKAIGKEPVEVAEAPGFVVNRLLIPMINEAVGLVETGVASVEDIDKAMQLGANHPMGPLTLGDFIGLDVCLAIMDVLYEETRDTKYRASLLLRKMVAGGLLGRKTGKGFYEYNK